MCRKSAWQRQQALDWEAALQMGGKANDKVKTMDKADEVGQLWFAPCSDVLRLTLDKGCCQSGA